jgi:hypothetical protein
MGNTKYITFAGNIYKGEEEFFSEESLLTVAHGDHVGVKVLPTYLYWKGEEVGPDDLPYVIGHLTTHSMGGFAVVDYIVSHMESGHVEKIDVDWGDGFWLNVQSRSVISQVKMSD